MRPLNWYVVLFEIELLFEIEFVRYIIFFYLFDVKTIFKTEYIYTKQNVSIGGIEGTTLCLAGSSVYNYPGFIGVK